MRKKYGFAWTEWECFSAIGERRETTATEIARVSDLHKTKVSRAIAALEGRGLVTRKPHVTDRRIEMLTLSPSGLTVYREMCGVAINFQERLLGDGLDETFVAVQRSIDAIESRLAGMADGKRSAD